MIPYMIPRLLIFSNLRTGSSPCYFSSERSDYQKNFPWVLLVVNETTHFELIFLNIRFNKHKVLGEWTLILCIVMIMVEEGKFAFNADNKEWKCELARKWLVFVVILDQLLIFWGQEIILIIGLWRTPPSIISCSQIYENQHFENWSLKKEIQKFIAWLYLEK